MKNNFDRTKTETSKIGIRSVAILMFFVMLLTAIGSGSVLNAFALNKAADTADNAAAVETLDEAVEDLTPADIYDTEDTMLGVTNSADTDDGTDGGVIAKKGDADLAETGYSGNIYVRGSWSVTNNVWDDHEISTSSSYSVTLAAGTDYSFVYCAAENRDQFSSSTTISSSVSSYNFSRNDSEAITLRTTIAGTYTFAFNGFNGDSISISITFPVDNTPDTWTVAGGTGGNTTGGQADNLFTSTWDMTLTQNDMTNTGGTTWTWSKSNVTLPQGNILCKVGKNHSYDTSYPSSNASYNIATAGDYNVTITFDSSSHAVTITATAAAKSTLSVQNDIANAVVTATYDGTTVGEGQSISNVPQGASVSISVTPDSGYQCTAMTGTYNTSSTVSGTGSGNSWTLEMPAADTTVSVTLGTVTMKKIYFNNNYTQYGTVYAYVYDKDGTNHTYEYLGARPGKVMKETDNTEIWYIEVPQDVDYVEFISGDGKTTGELTIPSYSTYPYPKYTAPYNYDAPTETNGGTWGNYIWGDVMGDDRANVYTVSDGSTMSGSNLFTGITATLYDYYTDGEITASAGTASDDGSTVDGWIKGIKNDEYTWTNSGWKWIPYTKLNGALIGYADNTNQPTYNITYPLYFGNLNYNSNANEVSGYYNYNKNANNSTGLTHDYNAVTGLSGKTLGDDNTIHYYSASDTTNENGAPMAMFNEDFLSGENTWNAPLATILRTSSFPVRKETVSQYPDYIYMDAGRWSDSNAKIWAHFWNSDNTSTEDVQMTSDGTYYTTAIPNDMVNVCFVRTSSSATSIVWNGNDHWAQSGNFSVPTSTTNANRLYTHTGTGNDDWGSFSQGNIASSYATGSHDYYEFDSTNGKDNAYIESIDKSDKTAVINYYNDTNKVHSNSSTDGFFPFNRNNLLNSDYAQDLGFGMKLTIPFTLNTDGLNDDNTAQTFDFSGDDDLWVFVDGKLVLDLGGAHARTEGTINFNTKTITNTTTQVADGSSATRNGSFTYNTNPNYVHTMTIYYMERGMFDSNLKFGFSFHAIPNQFWIDKKVRTKDKYDLGYDTLNSGLFTDNGQSGSASNMTTYTFGAGTTEEKTVAMSKFEKSFQDESFTVTQWYGSSSADTLASGKNYTIDYETTTYTTESSGTYPIKHDRGNAFINQFTTDDKFKLKETVSSSNKYVYTPVFTVWDQANNDQAVTFSGDNTNGYTFDFSPTTSNANTGIENTNIKARFDNYMSAHDLVLTKKLTNATDTSTSFNFQILFDFDGTGYVSYPLYYTHSDGTRAQLSNTGTVSLKAGESITIDKIPDKAQVKIVEILPKSVSGYRYDSMTVKNGTAALTTTAVSSSDSTTITKGATFTTSDNTTYVTFSNKKPDNSYTIQYTYPSYDNLYGNQSYTVTGVFTPSELDTYMQFTNAEAGTINFRSADLKKNFINSKSPYEDNFKQTVDFSNATITSETWDAGGNYTAYATASTVNSNQISVYFSLPYAVDDSLVPQESGTSGKVAKIANQAVGSKKITYLDWYVTSGSSTPAAGGSNYFVKAPLMIYTDVSDSDSVRYFQYWSVKKVSTYGSKAAEYTRCYDYEFNLALFMDCYIEPIYDTEWAQISGNPRNPSPPTSYNHYERFDPEVQIANDSSKGLSIAFLENSRNQWNNDDGGSKTGLAADTIYSDFLLSFNNVYGTQQLNQLPAGTKSAGIVIEAAETLDGSNAEGYDGSKDYNTDASCLESESTSRTAILSWLGGTGNQPSGVQKKQFDVRSLDNKNCIQYFTSIKNRNVDDTGKLLNTNNNRYKVFRAYAYIGNGASTGALTNVQLSQPVYFTIYDIGKLYDLADNLTS